MPIELIKQITIIKTAQLVPNDWNPNEMTPQQYDRLKKEIKDRGFQIPLVVRVRPRRKEDVDCPEEMLPYEIIDGEHRWRAGSELGMTEFPCLIFDVKDSDEAAFRTYVLNNLRGEINEVKLAVLVSNWHKKGHGSNLIYDRTGIKAYQQEALVKTLTPKTISESVMHGAQAGQHKSFAVILSQDENEILHRAIKLTRLKNEVEAVMEIVDYYLQAHKLSFEAGEKLKQVLEVGKNVTDVQGLVDLATFYLANVTKDQIRRDKS